MLIDGKRSSVITACVVSFVISTVCSAAAAEAPTCKTGLPSTKVHGGIVSVTAKKHWQPRGGEFTFVIDTPAAMPSDALITVCFGWKLADKPTDPNGFIESRPTRIVKLEPDKKSMTIAATVPDLPPALPLFGGNAETAKGDQRGKVGVYQGFGTVPVADVRILVYRPDGESIVDVLTTAGVTRVPWAVAGALGAVAIALVLLYWCSRIRQPELKANPLLRVIASERNYASLSQAQIILWTLVVGASAVYVMALSGDLIDITGGTLVLLGIAGVATVASKWKSALDDRPKPGAAPPAGGPPPGAAGPPPATPPPGAPAPTVPAPAPAPVAPAAVAPPAAPPVRPVPLKAQPEWADLVISVEMVDGKPVQTIDVTRVQMLFFTLITAAFVVLTVGSTYEIPPIPDGFMTLMGISNGVYLGSKFAK